MAAVTRPMPVTITDFNEILDKKIEFFDSNGTTILTSFWSALHYAPASAKALLERLDARVKHYQTAEDKSGIAAELKAFQVQHDHFATLVATARTVVTQFEEMRDSFEKTSRSNVAKPIMLEADITTISSKITAMANELELTYLTHKRLEGTAHVWNSTPSIPGRLEKLKGFQDQEKA